MGDTARKEPAPEAAACQPLGQGALDQRTPAFGKMRKLAQTRRERGINPRAHHLRQNRGCPFRTDSNGDRRTVDDGGRQKIAKCGTVNHIDRNFLRLRGSSNGAILRFIAGCDKNQLCAIEMLRRERCSHMLRAVACDELGQMMFCFFGNDAKSRRSLRHKARLVQSFLAAANDDNHLFRYPEEGRKISQ